MKCTNISYTKKATRTFPNLRYSLYIIDFCHFTFAVRATIFNCARQAPDVIHDTYSGPESPTTSVSVVGFRWVATPIHVQDYTQLDIQTCTAHKLYCNVSMML